MRLRPRETPAPPPKRYRLNLVQVNKAAERGARDAVNKEIERQLLSQGVGANVNCRMKIDIDNANVKVNGTPVEWVIENETQ
jgi:hypothetical protein